MNSGGTKITLTSAITTQPRAKGRLRLEVKSRGKRSAIARLEQSGASRMLFSGDEVDGIILNTAGGVTGGDQFGTAVHIAKGSVARLTTQAAERLYRAPASEEGRIETQAVVDGTLHWLPQETILFDGARVTRRFQADLSPEAQLLFVEPIVYGRMAMGEDLTNAAFKDSIILRRAGTLLYRDTTDLKGDIASQLDRPTVANGARAMALVIYAAADAMAHLEALRRLTPNVSLIRDGLLVARLLAADAYDLRRALVPLLTHFTDLPRSWSL